MKCLVWRASLIVVGGAALGLLANAISPRGIPLVPPPMTAEAVRKDIVSLAEARQAWESGSALFLDARNTIDYAAGHIPNALNLPAEQFDVFFPRVAPMLTPEMAVVVYCDGEQCDLSHEVQAKLRGLGFKNVRVLVNAWTVWKRAGLSGNTGDQP